MPPHSVQIELLQVKGGKFLKKLWYCVGRKATLRNISFTNSLRWLIYVINTVDKTKVSCFYSFLFFSILHTKSAGIETRTMTILFRVEGILVKTYSRLRSRIKASIGISSPMIHRRHLLPNLV